ncbi:MAG: SIMPL domain-containing protein [Mangrovibacterium sp.]
MKQTRIISDYNCSNAGIKRTKVPGHFILKEAIGFRGITLGLFLSFLLFNGVVQGQQTFNPLESTPYIEVTGEGEMEIIPDEIFLRFTLKERYDGKSKTALDELEKKLRELLVKNKFSLENLSLANANADYITIKRQKKDVLQSKDFILQVSTTSELTGLWNILDEVDAQNAFVSRVDHSKMEELEKEVKIKAVKNAKEKADYLLSAVGEKSGSILFLQERENFSPMYLTKSMQRAEMSVADERAGTASPSEPEISFQKIKLNYKVFARFAIQ